MADDDLDYDDDEPAEEADGENGLGLDAAEGGAGPESGAALARLVLWLDKKRGWLLLIGMSLALALFSTIIIFLRSEARPVAEVEEKNIRALAVEMLGHEVKIGGMHQVLPGRAGKRMTVGLDLVLVLGQLPEERVEGAPRPTPQEYEAFVAAVRDLEPGIRSRVNTLLQRMPSDAFGTTEALAIIKNDIRKYVNDELERLNFGANLRAGIDKRRVTEVLLPMFVRQRMK